jgi:putative transposase
LVTVQRPAHLRGEDDALVRVRPLLDLVPGWQQYVDETDTDTLHEQLNLHARTGRPLGSEAFVEDLEARLGRVLRPKKPGPQPKHRAASTPDMFSDQPRG